MFQRQFAYLWVVVAVAIALHGYESVVAWDSSQPGVVYWALGVLLWSMTPYALCAIVARHSASAIPSSVGASVALLFDLAMHHEISVSTSSTSALGFMFMPLWNLILLAPISMLFVYWVIKKSRANQNAP